MLYDKETLHVNFNAPTDGCYSCKHTNITINKLLQTFMALTVNNVINNNNYLRKKKSDNSTL